MDGTRNQSLQRRGRIGIVISGAAARGPFEAGVLAELIPRLFPGGSLRDALLVGTSSGAVNAALWAHLADGKRSLTDVGEGVCDFWLHFDQPEVFDFKFFGLLRPGPRASLLDVAPLMENAPRQLKVESLTSPLGAGDVGALAVVATSCGEHAYEGRSAVFFDGSADCPSPSEKGGRDSLDYIRSPCGVTLEHVLASAAIPVMFPPVQVTQPESATGHYIDGGVRLNTPIRVALDLGAQRIAVVSSHATEYPPDVGKAAEQPDVVDVTAQSLHSVLANGMIEDLRTLKRLNRLVAESGAPLHRARPSSQRATYQPIELIEAAPNHGQLGKLAERTLKTWPKSCREASIRLRYRFFGRVLAGFGRGSGNSELLSYMLFDKEFAKAQIAEGRKAGKRAAERGWALNPASEEPQPRGGTEFGTSGQAAGDGVRNVQPAQPETCSPDSGNGVRNVKLSR